MNLGRSIYGLYLDACDFELAINVVIKLIGIMM